eukprot:1147128-Lingulodinium_polyedra.AAC.1
MAGPAKNLAKGWALIREHIQMEDPTPMQLYLGCIHKRFEGKVDGIGPVIGIEYDMESFLASCVQRYLKLCLPD